MKFRTAGAFALSAAIGVLVTACGQGADTASDPGTVTINSGTLVGSVEDGVASFKGVPYAQPPVGDLRWRAPQPISWEGERQATEYGLPCPQTINEDGSTNGGGVAGETSEDCLYMNVYAPADAEGAPVMLWLYGGAGTLGAGHLGSYQGKSFAHEGVITVTINYRLGNLASFVHPALEAERPEGEGLGSYALMDAVAALEWIQANIDQFGGDASNVTLFGQSAGGMMVSGLLASPAADGLFQKAIVHSGSSTGAGTSIEDASAAGARLATNLGLNGADATAEELRAVPVDALVSTRGGMSAMTAVLDGVVKEQTTTDAFNQGSVPVLVIAGSNNGEGGVNGASNLVNMAAADDTAAWQYYFTFVPDWRADEWANGAIHSGEIMYAWNSTDTSSWGGENTTDADREVARLMHSCWVAFAKAPQDATSLNCADGFVWESRVPGEGQAAQFDATPSMIDIRPIVEEAEVAAAERAAAIRARMEAAGNE